MYKLEINIYPKDKKILLTKTVPIDLELLDEFKNFIMAMKSFVADNDDALAVAANQVWNIKDIPAPRIFVMGRQDTGTVEEYVNPTAIYTGKTLRHVETCLSRPGKSFVAKRSKNCSVHYYTMSGEEKVEKYGGTYAQIISHEIQHLDGDILKKEVKPKRW